MIQEEAHLSRRKLMDLRFDVKKNMRQGGAECFIQKRLQEIAPNTIGCNPHPSITAKDR